MASVESVGFPKVVAPGWSTQLQWMASCPDANGKQKLKSLKKQEDMKSLGGGRRGRKREELRVRIGVEYGQNTNNSQTINTVFL